MTRQDSDAAPSRRAARRGDEQDAGVVTMLQELAPQLDVDPDPEYLRAARQRLVAMAAVRTPEPVRPTALRRLLAARAPAGRWRTRAAAGLAGAALTVTSLATLVALAAGAGPGDVLYGVKRGTEQTQLALAGDSRGQELLDLARTRLEELDDLDGDAGLIASTLSTMDDQTTEGASWYLSRAADTADPAALDTVSRWAGEQSAQLQVVGAGLPAASADEVAASLGLLEAITARADGWRTALDCPRGAEPAGADRLGPEPGACLAAVEAPETAPAPPTPQPPVPGAPAPSAPEPVAPTPGGTPPQAVTGPTPVQPTVPAAPTGALPVPGVPSVPGLPSLPTAPPGGLPSLTVPVLPPPTTPSASAGPTGPPPVVQVPSQLLPCVDIPVLLRAGNC